MEPLQVVPPPIAHKEQVDASLVPTQSEPEVPNVSLSDLMALVQSANELPDKAQRDSALIDALRTARKELEAVEQETARAKRRWTDAQEAFDLAVDFLAGGGVDEKPNVSEDEGRLGQFGLTVPAASRTFATRATIVPKAYLDPLEEPLPENPIIMPPIFSEGGGATSEMVAAHREAFYQQLINVPASHVDDYVPNDKQANLRSKAQLVESMYIVEHWYTGADGLDVGSFRAKHKTWYTRMKPHSVNIGRRTGIHVRALATPPSSNGGQQYEGGETVLCRFNRDGTKSIVYLDVGKIFDALFQIHSVQLDHKGKDVIKAQVDELYANIPDGQVKIFVDTCPVCMERRLNGQQEA